MEDVDDAENPSDVESRAKMRQQLWLHDHAGWRSSEHRTELLAVQDADGDGQITKKEDAYGVVVRNAIKYLDDEARQQAADEIQGRAMVKNNSEMFLRVVVERRGGREPKTFLVSITNSIKHMDLLKLLRARCGLKAKYFVVLWVMQGGGETIKMNTEQVWSYLVHSCWCVQPWTLHVRDEEDEEGDRVEPVTLHTMAKVLFDRYDVHRDGRVQKAELLRMLQKDLSLKSFIDCSDLLVARFVEDEYAQLDTDKSGGLTLPEFTRYITSMKPWMRMQLMQKAHQRNVFTALASRATVAVAPPMAVPPPEVLADGRIASIVDTGVFGIRLEVPPDALGSRAKSAAGAPRVSVQTLPSTRAHQLAEGVADGISKGESIFSPIVRVDLPAFEGGDEPPDIGGVLAPPFAKPITLVMPHSFDPKDGEESVVFLGAAHGASKWENIHSLDGCSVPLQKADMSADLLQLRDHELRAVVPYAGVFCAFTSPEVEDIAAVRFFIYSMPELPRDDPSSLRVHLCPNLPDQIEEMELSESAEWGLIQCVGSSPVLYLCQGARFVLKYEDDRTGERQEQVLTWQGGRINCEFTLPICGDKGEEPEESDPDEREILRDQITVVVVEGEGRRASRIHAVAKRAGIPEEGMDLPFCTRLKSEVRPHAPILRLRKRTAKGFTVTWRKPLAIDGDGDGDFAEITHYSLELGTTTPAGTYYPYEVLWSGAGHVPPDFAADLAMKKAVKANDRNEIARLKAAEATKAAEMEVERAEDQAAAISGGGNKKKRKKRPASSKKTKAAGLSGSAATVATGAVFQEKDELYSYSLEVPPALFGRLRIRCWAEGEARPSRYSAAVRFPRWNGEAETRKNNEQKVLEAETVGYYSSLRQHVTNGLAPATHRIGNQAFSRDEWGGRGGSWSVEDGHPGSMQMPYDVPALPVEQIPGLAKAASTLAAFYEEMGVEGGGGGIFCGLRIDQVLHAIMGTPTVNGQYSPRRCSATLHEPLIAFTEVVYTDVLLPLLDSVLVARSEWAYVDEKMMGMVSKIATLRPFYSVIESHLKEIIGAVFELYAMMLLCQEEEQGFVFHLEHQDYPKSLKRRLKGELVNQIIDVLWKVSTEFLEMLLEIRHHSPTPLSAWDPPPSLPYVPVRRASSRPESGSTLSERPQLETYPGRLEVAPPAEARLPSSTLQPGPHPDQPRQPREISATTALSPLVTDKDQLHLLKREISRFDPDHLTAAASGHELFQDAYLYEAASSYVTGMRKVRSGGAAPSIWASPYVSSLSETIQPISAEQRARAVGLSLSASASSLPIIPTRYKGPPVAPESPSRRPRLPHKGTPHAAAASSDVSTSTRTPVLLVAGQLRPYSAPRSPGRAASPDNVDASAESNTFVPIFYSDHEMGIPSSITDLNRPSTASFAEARAKRLADLDAASGAPQRGRRPKNATPGARQPKYDLGGGAFARRGRAQPRFQLASPRARSPRGVRSSEPNLMEWLDHELMAGRNLKRHELMASRNLERRCNLQEYYEVGS